MSSGFDRADLSLLAPEKMVDEKLGHGYQSVAELQDEAAVPQSCYIAPESIGILFKTPAAMCMCMRCQQQHKFKSGDDMTR
jgi:hypothetical protein